MSNILSKVSAFLARAIAKLSVLCKKGWADFKVWFKYHFADDIKRINDFKESVKRKENKIVNEIKFVGRSLKKAGHYFAAFFNTEKRRALLVAVSNKKKAVKSKVNKHGFSFWFNNSRLLHKRFFGSVGIALSLIVFGAVFATNAYAMNCIAVRVNGETIGYVENIEAFDESVRIVEERVSLGTNGEYKLGIDIKYSFDSVPQDQISTTSDMIDKILRNSGTSIVDAYGLYVDGELWAVCRDKETIDGVTENMLRPYREKNTQTDGTVRFTQNTEIVYGLYPAGLLCSEQDLQTIIGDTKGYKSYRVQQGDTLESIAMMNNTTVENLQKMNENLAEELVVGSDINVESNKAKLTVQTVVRKTYDKKIAYKTQKTRTKSLNAGTTKVEQKGENGLERVTSDFIYVDGKLSEEIVIESETIKEAVTEKVLVGTKSTGSGSGSSTGNYMRPISGGYVSSKYGYRGSEFHTGVDFAAPAGTPIMAADGGTVVAAVYSGSGYGRYIVIQHSNGEQTLYGHCSALYVTSGEKVDKGQVIAAVGRTGRASGNHVHFEVRRNGSPVYPGF